MLTKFGPILVLGSLIGCAAKEANPDSPLASSLPEAKSVSPSASDRPGLAVVPPRPTAPLNEQPTEARGEKTKKTPTPLMKLMSSAKPGADGWTSSAEDPAKWLAAADKKLKSLNGATCDFQFRIQMAGGQGFSSGKSALESPKRFRLEYPVVIVKNRPDVYKESLVVKEAKYTTISDVGNGTPKPLSLLKRGPSGPWETAFPSEFPRLLFSGYATGLTPLTEYLRSVRSQGGYKIRGEVRRATVAGKSIVLQRILVTRTPEKSQLQGPFHFEIILDGSLSVPITFRNDLIGSDHKPIRIFWTGAWELSGQKFTEKTFGFPAPKVGA